MVVHLTHSVSRLAGGLFESVRHLATTASLAGNLDLRVIALTDHKTNQDFKAWFPGPVQACGLRNRVIFSGEVRGVARTRLYCDSDLFVLPSFSENFGLMIAEALSCEVPVITTRATPWREIKQRRCGWWIEGGVEPLAEALRKAMSLPFEELSQMGRRGRQLIHEKYTWQPVGQTVVEVDEWMLGRRAKPTCIVE